MQDPILRYHSRVCVHLFPLAFSAASHPHLALQPNAQDPILRYGGMFVLGLAYCGTSNNAAIQKLLHFAVSGACVCPGWLAQGSTQPAACCRLGMEKRRQSTDGRCAGNPAPGLALPSAPPTLFPASPLLLPRFILPLQMCPMTFGGRQCSTSALCWPPRRSSAPASSACWLSRTTRMLGAWGRACVAWCISAQQCLSKSSLLVEPCNLHVPLARQSTCCQSGHLASTACAGP